MSEVSVSTPSTIRVIVATHKQAPMPSDSMYLPLHVGRAESEDLGYQGDNEGDNISAENSRYCELTGLYWAWKNLEADYKGMVQYRRHFQSPSAKNSKDLCSALTSSDALTLLSQTELLLPKRRNYRIQSLAEHFEGGSFALPGDIALFRDSIDRVSPGYLVAFDKVMARTWGHMFNMFIMPTSLLNEYCDWLFKVMDCLDENIPAERTRVLGYFAEHMIDIWVEQHSIPYSEVQLLSLDKENEMRKRVGYLLRILGFKDAADSFVKRQK